VEKEGVKKSGPLTDLAKRMIGDFEALTQSFGTEVLPYDNAKAYGGYNGQEVRSWLLEWEGSHWRNGEGVWQRRLRSWNMRLTVQ